MMSNNFNIPMLLGVLLISIAISFAVFNKTYSSDYNLMITVYTFGSLFLSGLFTLYPKGRSEQSSQQGLSRKARINDLSSLQSRLLLIWILGGGAMLIYLIEFYSAA